MTSLSLIGDVCLYKICKMFHRNHNRCLLMYASSYVTLVFMTRTLSNVIEALLFIILLLIVASSVKRSVASRKRKVKSNEHTNNFNWVGILLTVGIFNRPTFVFYSVVPMFFWLIYNSSLECTVPKRVVINILSLVPSIAISSILFITGDSIYFGVREIFWNSKSFLEVEWIIAPLNFIRYNVDDSNLRQHGLHPQYLHILVNLPLLFGLVSIYASIHIIKLVFCCLSHRKRNTVNIIDHVIIWSFVMPILLLSLIPHQEPRFLLPVLFPLVIFSSDRMFQNNNISRLLLITWTLWNVFGCLFYGFLQQSGVVHSLFDISANRSATQCEDVHVVFYHTYMPPRFLLLNPKERSCCEYEIHVHDLMGSSLNFLKTEVETLSKMQQEFFLIAPTSIHDKVQSVLQFNSSIVKRFYWHLSMEDPPPFTSFTSFITQIGLNVYSIQVRVSSNHTIERNILSHISFKTDA